MKQALEEIRVLAGLYTTMIMADMGTDVIRIEDMKKENIF
ncbi:CoA transferase [Geosporobacter ferrireducens]|nr:CoA transferase [Geosporobacter ferrireducens]MTI54773.1 hypothetical protein [Geosporobacter ferrireducens]